MKILKRHFSSLLIISLIVLVSYGGLTQMYLWHDDYTTLYELSQGRLMFFPYHFTAYLTKLFYPFFGLEPKGYFTVGVILYLTASFLLYSLTLTLFKKKSVALLATLTFAAGHVGQDEMKMFLGTGFGTILGINALFLSVITLIKSKDNKKIYFLLSLFFFFLALEFSPYRLAGFFATLVIIDIIFSKPRVNYFYAALRNFCFAVVFILQYVIHPSNIVLGYPLSPVPETKIHFTESLIKMTNSVLSSITLVAFLKQVGTFWNVFLPQIYLNSLYFYLRSHYPQKVLSLSLIPIFVFATFIFFLFYLLRRRQLSKRIIFIRYFSFLLISSGWCTWSTKFFSDPIDKISVANGGVLIIFLSFLLIYRYVSSIKNALLSVAIAFGGLSIYVLANKDFIFETPHRYLLSLAFVPAFLLSFFIPQEIYKTTKGRNLIAWLILVIPAVSTIILHLTAGVTTQKTFIKEKSTHARNIYNQLHQEIPKVTDKTLVYIEGSSPALDNSVGDSLRVGALSSEAALAVQFNVNQELFVLPSKLDELSKIVRDHSIEEDNIYTFIYDGNSLNNTSESTRSLLKRKDLSVKVTPMYESVPEESTIVTSQSFGVKTVFFTLGNKTLGIYPQININFKTPIESLLPIKVDIRLGNKIPDILPLPYYHLKNLPEYPKKSLWSEILFWEISQCREDIAFDCVTSKDTLEKNNKAQIEVTWDYDSYGSPANSKSTFLEMDTNMINNYEFIVPPGGTNLTRLTIRYISFPGTLEIYSLRLSYII